MTHAGEEALRCGACAFDSPPGMSWCGMCGAALAAAAEAPAPRAGERRPREADAERRQLTLLFCDLAGARELAASQDPAAYRAAIERFHDLASEAVARREGHVAQLLGEGLLAYFGYPVAHEEDPRNAVLAALEIKAACAAAEKDGPALSPRIGIHSGLVVAGEVGAGSHVEALAVGETPNVAARILGLAASGEILVSDATAALTAGFFVLESLGARSLKGVARAVTVRRVVAESELRSQFDVRRARGLSPLVGRALELEHLLAAFDDAAAGRGRFVMISGEAGIGKSRLHHDFVQAIEPRLASRTTLRCSTHHVATALAPVLHVLGQVAGLSPQQAPEERLARLEEACRRTRVEARTAFPLIAPLLGVPLGAHPPIALNRMQRKAATLALLADILLPPHVSGPVLVTVEDVHWADATTLALLDLVAARLERRRALLVVTFRPSFTPRWSEGGAVSRLSLTRLTEPEVERLALSVTGGRPLARQLLRELVRRTDGVPLFVEELTRTLVESEHVEIVGGRWELRPGVTMSALPLTLQDSLTARLDRLPACRDVAQVGAVLGRRFDYRLLRAVSGLSDADLAPRLGAAVGGGLLREQGAPPDSHYAFHHALIRDAAYETLLKSRRRELHEAAGRALESEFTAVAEAEPEVLAHHYAQAGLAGPAVLWSQRAGRKAGGLWAHLEAVHHYQRAVGLLDALPPEGRDERELLLRSEMGASLIATRGYAGAEVEANLGRAAELCGATKDPPLSVEFGLWAMHLLRGDVERTRAMVESMQRRLEVASDPIERIAYLNQVGDWHYYRGDMRTARRYLERAVAEYSPDQHAAIARATGGSGGLYAPTFLALVLWYQGEPAASRDLMEWSLETAETLGDPFALAETLMMRCALGREAHLVHATRGTAERLLDLAREQGLLWAEAVALIMRGWAATHGDGDGDSRADIEQGLRLIDAMQARLLRPYFGSALTEWHLAAGRHEEGLAHVAGLSELCKVALDTFYDAEIGRLHADLLLRARGDAAAAEAHLASAMALADEQGNRLLALRAAVDLARLRLGAGRAAEARDLVAPRYEACQPHADFEDYRAAAGVLAEARAAVDA